MTFRVGQKVVCVNASDWAAWGTIEEDRVYTVASTAINQGRPALNLIEVPTVCNSPYFAYRFRPAVECKTDISALKALLVPGVKIREPVA